MGVVFGVVGGCGGIGASRFAAVLAAVASARAGRCLLVDLDPGGGGLDVMLAAESVPGPRWSQLRLAGGALDAEVLLSGLPSWGRTLLLAADQADLPPADQVRQVIDSARGRVPVVVDLARHRSPARDAAAGLCSVIVVLCAGDLAAVTAARSVLTGLVGSAGAGDDRPARDPRVVVVARGARSVGARVAALIGAPLAATVPVHRGRDGSPLDPARPPRAMRRVASGLLQGLEQLDGPAERAESAVHRHRAAAVPAASGGWRP